MDAVLAKYPNLHHFGLSPYDDRPLAAGDRNFIPARIELIRQMIRASIVPTKKKWDIGSYGGKHYIEHLMDIYITNGEFILAMALEGYEVKQVVWGRNTSQPGRPTPNAVFRAKYKADQSIVHGKNWALRDLHARYKTKKVKAWEQVQDTVLMILFKVLYDAGRDPAKEPNLQNAVCEIVGRM